MANGEYGDFVQQLATSANRSITYHTQKSTADDSGVDCTTPVIKVNTLGCIDAPLLLKKQLSIDGCGNDVITVPTEWSKFWTLVRRCHVHYYRDWVCAASVSVITREKTNRLIRSIADGDSFEIDAAYIVCDFNWSFIWRFGIECE